MVVERMLSQTLAGPRNKGVAEVVEWMGAVQAQEIRAAKWAVELRMAEPSLAAVREALDCGKILRMHVMRPTWHYIPARDVKWMAALSEKFIKSAWDGYSRATGITKDDYYGNRELLLRILEGRHATKNELVEEFITRGIKTKDETERFIRLLLMYGEAEGVICSGVETGGKHTYALTSERVPDAVEKTREEAMSELARRYFRSHGPAGLEDFVWWSGLGVREARSAVASLGKEIVTESVDGWEMFTHETSPAIGCRPALPDKGVVRFLPPFDEYLISYKNRLDCIREDHCRYAYNNFGIFQPVILHNGRITGNWKKTTQKSVIETTFFPGCRPAAKRLLEQAAKEYNSFHGR